MHGQHSPSSPPDYRQALVNSSSVANSALTFSVVSVVLSLQASDTDTIPSSDPGTPYFLNGSSALGHRFVYGVVSNGTICDIAYQVTGIVTPSNYPGQLYLKRTATYDAWLDPGQQLTYSKTNWDDTSADPLVNYSSGIIYDLDGPGKAIYGTDAVGTIRRLRINFDEYAVLGSRSSTTKVSTQDLLFYSRSSCGKASSTSVVFDQTYSGKPTVATIKSAWGLRRSAIIFNNRRRCIVKSTSRFLMIVMSMSLPLWMHAQESKCPDVDTSSADNAVTLLDRLSPNTTDIQEKICIEHAIGRLAQRKSDRDISVLIPYLTFKRSKTAEEQNGFYLHPPSELLEYPAIGALARAGIAVRKPLVDAIAGASSQEAIQNATKALLLSYQCGNGESPANGISLLKTSAQNQTETGTAHLIEAMRYGLTLDVCKQSHNECDKAAQ